MAIRFLLDHDNVYRVEVTGLLGEKEFGALQQSAAAEIRKAGKIRLLIVLDHFAGWAPGNWNSLAFYVQHGDDIERIAIVGDERWRSETMMFAGADLRQGAVMYFAPPYRREAVAWLAQGDA
jgi:hypothetical protein